jgi:flagellar motility protein MotE (MotC chaperone)
MSGKKMVILVLAGIGLAGFGVSFAVTRFLAVGPKEATGQAAPGNIPGGASAGPGGVRGEVARLEERHLYDLIGEVRKKLREADRREEQLALEENRIKMVRDEMKEEADKLEDLRVEVAAAVSALKEARAELRQSRITVQNTEEANLKRLAASYDTMSAEAASRIFQSMCQNSQYQDAVKILRYMRQRNVGKVLAALPDQALAAKLSDGLKRLTASEG